MMKKMFLLFIVLPCMGNTCYNHYSKVEFELTPCLNESYKLPESSVDGESKTELGHEDYGCKYLKNYETSLKLSNLKMETGSAHTLVSFLDKKRCKASVVVVMLSSYTQAVKNPESYGTLVNEVSQKTIDLLIRGSGSKAKKIGEFEILKDKDELENFCKLLQNL